MGLHRVLVAVLVFIWISGWIQNAALAYVLDGRHVIDLMLEEMDLPSRMQVEQTLTVFDDRFEGGQMAVKQTVSYKIPGGFRSEILMESLHRIHVTAGEASITIVDDRIVSRQNDAINRYKDLFWYRDRQSLVNHLAYLGMNPRLSSYGRSDGEVVYVIGARYPDASPPQLWVSKDRLLPLRWVLSARGQDEASAAAAEERLAFQYENWRVAGGSRYPGEIKVFRGERLSRKIEINQVHINPAFPENLFDIDYLRAAYAQEPPKPSRPGRKPEDKPGGAHGDVPDDVAEDEIDQQIEEFRSIFESE